MSRNSRQAVRDGAVMSVEDDRAYMEALRGRLSERSLDVVERLDRVNSVYVESRRDKVLADAFSTFMEDFLSTRDGRRREADVFFVTGESGAGKTEAVARMLRSNAILQPHRTSFGTVSPYASLKLTGYILPRILAKRIISASGHPVDINATRGDAWNEVTPALRRRRVILVHIDEVQHVISGNGSAKDLAMLADALKGVSIATAWPVAFVLSGLPGIKALAMNDEQFERRGRWVHFPDLDMPAQAKLVVRIMRELADAAGLGLGSMPETDMPRRIAHVSNNRFARVCQMVVAAIHQALRAEKPVKELGRGHFALAYASRSRVRDNNHRNPFLVDDWASLPPGAFLDVEGTGGDPEAEGDEA